MLIHSGPHNLVNIYLRNDGIHKYQTAKMGRDVNRRRLCVRSLSFFVVVVVVSLFLMGTGMVAEKEK